MTNIKANACTTVMQLIFLVDLYSLGRGIFSISESIKVETPDANILHFLYVHMYVCMYVCVYVCTYDDIYIVKKCTYCGHLSRSA